MDDNRPLAPIAGQPGDWALVSTRTMPSGAFPAGVENLNSLLACRGLYQGAMYGGKAFSGAVCDLATDNAEVEIQPPFEVLMGGHYRWQSTTAPLPAVPASAIIVTNDATAGAQHVCRAAYDGGVHPGVLVGGHCRIGWGGSTMSLDQFDLLLAAPTTTVRPDGSGQLIWPNAESSANSDVWLAQHHNEITEIRPQDLIIHYANSHNTGEIMDRWNAFVEAFGQASRYHGYSDPNAKPFVKHVLRKLVDLSDQTIPAGWTAPNSTKMPRLNGGIDFAQLFTQATADQIGITDPQKSGHNLTLCELLDRGMINQLFVAFNKEGSDDNVPEIIEYKQRYDSNDNIILDQFDPYAGNGGFSPADLPAARACGRSLRVDFIEMRLNVHQSPGPTEISGAMHIFSHNMEHLGTALPNYAKFFSPLYNSDFAARFMTPFNNWYDLAGGGAAVDFIRYTGQNSVTWRCPVGSGCAGQSGTMDPYNQGCGNAHFAPNSQTAYDMLNPFTVLTRCQHYGLHDGPDGKDIQTPYNANTVSSLARYGADGNGGAWQVYLYQSFPGFGNKATTDDGTPIKNVWPYLFY